MGKYNIVVIGGGSGGLMVAAGATGLGARVALVEQDKMGGDCLNSGCVPSKALIHIARRAQILAQGGQAPSWEEVKKGVHAIIDTIAPHDSVERFTELGVDVLQGRGRLVGPHTVEASLNAGGTQRLETQAIVIATGSGPAVPPIAGLKETGYITNEEVFNLPQQPKRLLVLGGGAIGTELGQCFARLGSQVTLIEMEPEILFREEQEAAAVVAESLRKDGIELITGYTVLRVEKDPQGKRVFYRAASGEGEELSLVTDEILVAAGRTLSTADLGLDAAGVVYGRGGIVVDDKLRSNVPSVYACGDVTGAQLFTHTAGQQGRVIIQNALLPFKTKMDYTVIPACTFTDPELARVGMTEAEAAKKGIAHRSVQVPFSGNDRAVCDEDTAGFLKVVLAAGKDKILGATLVGAHAGENIHEIALAMKAGLGLKHIGGMVHAYPTRAEIMRRVADEARRAGFTPTMQRLFAGYLRWRRR